MEPHKTYWKALRYMRDLYDLTAQHSSVHTQMWFSNGHGEATLPLAASLLLQILAEALK